MPPNSPVGQDTVNTGAWKPPAGHGHGAQAVALAQHDAEERHAQMGGGYEQAADMAHLRRLLGLGPTMKPGVSTG
jgi:hypothetical protein